jgi:hypothetical protein
LGKKGKTTMRKQIKIAIATMMILLLQGCASYYKDTTIYPCSIGCGDESITPPKGYVYYQNRMMKLSEFNRITGQNVVIR